MFTAHQALLKTSSSTTVTHLQKPCRTAYATAEGDLISSPTVGVWLLLG